MKVSLIQARLDRTRGGSEVRVVIPRLSMYPPKSEVNIPADTGFSIYDAQQEKYPVEYAKLTNTGGNVLKVCFNSDAGLNVYNYILSPQTSTVIRQFALNKISVYSLLGTTINVILGVNTFLYNKTDFNFPDAPPVPSTPGLEWDVEGLSYEWDIEGGAPSYSVGG